MKRPDAASERFRKEIRPGVWLDSGLALIFESAKTLVISDIHWGYSAVHRRYGNLFPVWGDLQIETGLNALLAYYRPDRMIWLGDSIHGASGQEAAESYLAKLSPSLEVILIGGNHDRRWERELHADLRLGEYLLHHGDIPREIPEGICEVVGHWHPSVTHRDGAGLCLKLPILVQQPFRLILPAFSPWSRGTDWRPESNDVLWVASPRRIWRHRTPADFQ